MPIAKPNRVTAQAELRGHKAAKRVRDTVKLDPGVDPNHAWRHTWKMHALEVGIEERLRDGVTGHHVASVGRRYETPTLAMMSDAMAGFPATRLDLDRGWVTGSLRPTYPRRWIERPTILRVLPSQDFVIFGKAKIRALLDYI